MKKEIAFIAVFAAFTAAVTVAATTSKLKTKETQPKITRIDAPIQITLIRASPAETIFTQDEILESKQEEVYIAALDLMENTPLEIDVQLEIESMCAARDVDPAVVVAMIYHESRYDEFAIGDNGNSFGLMQIQPRWHQGRMDKLGVTDLLDGVQNVMVGIDYLDELLDKYDGDYGKALTAYNQGHYKDKITNYAINVLEVSNELRNDRG